MKLLNSDKIVLFLVLCALAAPSSFVLADGPLQIAFENDPTLPIVYLHVAIKGGAVTDPARQAGLTNFIGESLLRGTKMRSKKNIDETLDRMSATLQVETRAESLIFRGAVLSGHLNPFLKLLQEILTNPGFPENEIRKLKSEVISMIEEQLSDDSSLALIRFNRFLFQNHPYGNPILGKVKDIARLTRSQLLTHYHCLFQGKALIIAGTGDASENQIIRWGQQITEAFSERTITPQARHIEEFAPPKNADRRRLLIVDKPDRTQTQINIGQIGIRLTDPDFFPLYLGNHAFGGPIFSAILMNEIRVKRGWSYAADSTFQHGIQPRSWYLRLFPSQKDTANALAHTLKAVEALKEKGLSQEQFEFAKSSLVNSSEFMYNTPKKRVDNILLERSLDLPNGFIRSFGPALKAVTLSQVNQSLRTFLNPDRLVISVLGTASELKAPLAKAAEVPLEQLEIVPYTED